MQLQNDYLLPIQRKTHRDSNGVLVVEFHSKAARSFSRLKSYACLSMPFIGLRRSSEQDRNSDERGVYFWH